MISLRKRKKEFWSACFFKTAFIQSITHVVKILKNSLSYQVFFFFFFIFAFHLKYKCHCECCNQAPSNSLVKLVIGHWLELSDFGCLLATGPNWPCNGKIAGKEIIFQSYPNNFPYWAPFLWKCKKAGPLPYPLTCERKSW